MLMICFIYFDKFAFFFFFRVNPIDYSWETYLFVPKIRIEGNYHMQGRILVIPLNGHGKCWFEPSKNKKNLKNFNFVQNFVAFSIRLNVYFLYCLTSEFSTKVLFMCACARVFGTTSYLLLQLTTSSSTKTIKCKSCDNVILYGK